MTITQSSKFVTLALGVAVAGALVFGAFASATPAQAALTQSQVDAIISLLQSFGADAATIANVQASLTGGTPTVPSTPTGGTCYAWTRDLQQGSTGADVMALQKFLNGDAATMVNATGAGSPGNETSTFGPATKAAVMKFQTKYNVTPIAGYFGSKSRAQAALVCGGGSPTPPGPGPIPPGPQGTVSVGPAAQAANSLAPKSASQVPFTTFTLTNNSSAAVTVNSVTVERTGFAQDAVFSGVILVENSMRIGNSKTFNSNHQATLDAALTLQPGQSRTVTVAGDIASDMTSYVGQVASITVIAVNTTGTVSGSLPITGASHTVNNSLTVGSLAMTQGSSDPDASATKEIGVANYIFGSVRATAGSAEDVWVKSIRWNQGGSAGTTDINNVRVRIDGTDYPATADGRYYSVVFPGMGLEVAKGNQKEFEVRADIIAGTNRTVRFDLYKANDIYAVGEIYGYGVTPTQSESGTAANATSEFTAGTPFFDGSQVTISAGTVNSVSRANEVPAQNVAENTPNQPIGGFVVDIKGEGITVQQQIYRLTVTGTAGQPADLTSVTLVDENGAVVAGPVDGANAYGTLNGTVTFTDTVTFPTGRHVFTLKGKYGTDFTNGQTAIASTTPSTDWTTVKGVVTGDTVSLSTLSTVVSGNTMTLRTGAVALSINATPAAQNIVAGVTNVLLGQYNFDATQSGEDVRFTAPKFYYDEVTTMSIDPTNCFVWDGATRLSNTAVNPDADGDDTYTLDTTLTVPKGTVKIISIRCDIPGSASSGTFAFDLNFDTTAITTFTGVGTGSGQTITPTTPSAAITDGQTMTLSTGGALTVDKDSSSPAYKLAAGGSPGVTLGVLRVNGTNEDLKLDRVALQMSNIAATSTPADITQVTLWDGATQIGTALFSGTNRNATSTITGTVIIPANNFKIITVKGDLAAIGTGQAGDSGVLIEVDFDFDDSTGTRAIGQSSGTTVNHSSTADTDMDGVRMFRAYPTVAQLALPSSVLTFGNAKDLTRFSVTASNNGLGISMNEITISVGTTTGSDVSGTTTVENFDVYAYTDSAFSSPVSGVTDGLVLDGTNGVGVSGASGTGEIELEFTTVLNIAAGQTVYFKILGDITQTTGTGNFVGRVETKLLGDAAFPTAEATLMTAESDTDADGSNDDFVWSPNSTTTMVNATRGSTDWTNGFGIPGLPSAGLSGSTLTY